MSACERVEVQSIVPHALQVVIQTMRTETKSSELQLECCKALAGLTHTPRSREDAMKAGAVEAVSDCMIINAEVRAEEEHRHHRHRHLASLRLAHLALTASPTEQ